MQFVRYFCIKTSQYFKMTTCLHRVSSVHDSLVSLLPLPPVSGGLVLGEDLAPGPDRGGQPACTPALGRLTLLLRQYSIVTVTRSVFLGWDRVCQGEDEDRRQCGAQHSSTSPPSARPLYIHR